MKAGLYVGTQNSLFKFFLFFFGLHKGNYGELDYEKHKNI